MPRFPLHRTLGPLGVQVAAQKWWLAGGVSASNAVAAYQPKGAASLSASYSNLANPGTNDAAPGVAPTFASETGWTFTSTSQYLLTGLSPVTRSWSMLIRLKTGSSLGGYVAGVFDQPFYFRYVGGSPPFRFASGGQSDYLIAVSTNTEYVWGVAGTACYRDGSNVGTVSGSGNATSTVTGGIALGGLNLSPWNFGLGGSFQMYAVAIYSTTLTAAQVAAVSSAMAAL